MKKINKKFYLSAFIILGVLALILLFVGAMLENEDWVYTFIVPIFVIYVIGLVFHYKAWQAIQDGYATTSAAKAVGYLFIPMYNLYWLFRSLYGFANDYNDYIKRREIKTKKLPVLLYFYQCVLIIIFSISTRFESDGAVLVMFIALVWLYINLIIIVNKSANGVNALCKSVESEPVSDA